MELKLKTLTLQQMLSDAVKGAGNNKLVPLTGMLCINQSNGKLKLMTTDGTNYLYVGKAFEGEDFYVVLNLDIFEKLISKLTSEYVTLVLQDNKLSVTGNGDYLIELPLDENGQLVTFPDPISSFDINGATSFALTGETINKMLTAGKASIATTLEIPCYTGYYIGNKIVTTNTYKICSIDTNILGDKGPMLWNNKMVDLLQTIRTDNAQLLVKDNQVVVTNGDVLIYGTVLEGIDNYQIDPISSLVDIDFDSSAIISKEALCQVLDRLALFVGPYDNNSMKLTFGNDLQVSSKACTGIETIVYQSSNNPKPFECMIDIETLTSQVKSIQQETFTIMWGRSNAIKLMYGNIVHIIALLED